MAGTSFRNVVLNLHLWIGLAAAILLLLTGASGALLVFEDEIDAALNPQLARVTPSQAPLSLNEIKADVERQYPGGHVLGFELSERNDAAWGVYLQPASGDGFNLAVDQYRGKALGIWNDNRFTRKLHGFHTQLLAGEVGSAIVGWGAVLLLFQAVSGLILWWRTKVLRFSFQTSGPKFQYDLHSAVGVASSVFLLVFALTGILVHWEDAARRWAFATTHTSAPQIPQPAAPAAAASALDPVQLLTLAQTAVPGARATGIYLSDGPTSPAMVTMKFPEDHTPAGRTRIFLDAYSGKVLSLTNSREAPAAVAYVTRLNREIHTGDIAGWPTRLVAAISSACLPLLALTGPLLWWQRRKS